MKVHPLYARFGHSRRFGKILRHSGLLLPDPAYEIALVHHALALAPPPRLGDRLELRARLVLFHAPPDTSPAALADVEAGQQQLVALANEVFALKKRGDDADAVRTLEATRAQLRDALSWLRPRPDASPSLAAREMRALKAQARPLTLTEFALLADEFPDARDGQEEPPTPSPPKEWVVNPVFGLPPLPVPAEPEEEDAAPPPSPYARGVYDDPLPMPEPDDEDEPRGEKRPHEDLPEVQDEGPPPKRARLRGQHRTPTKPRCSHPGCQRQVAKPGGDRCSGHLLREAPPAGAYCVVCYYLAEADAGARAAYRAAIKEHLLSKEGATEAKVEAQLTKQWKELLKRRFTYKVPKDRGARPKCSRHREAAWAVPDEFVPRHANPNPNADVRVAPPLL